MKILIVSDTHRQNGNLCQALLDEKPVDMLIHLVFRANQRIVLEGLKIMVILWHFRVVKENNGADVVCAEKPASRVFDVKQVVV